MVVYHFLHLKISLEVIFEMELGDPTPSLPFILLRVVEQKITARCVGLCLCMRVCVCVCVWVYVLVHIWRGHCSKDNMLD